MTASGAAVLTRLGARAALSHESAARAWGIELLQDDGAERVTVPLSRSRAHVDGWWVVRADVAVVQRADGLRVTSALRTVADLARVLPLVGAVAAADSALRLQLVGPEVLTGVLLCARIRGVASLRAVGRHADRLSGSVVESAARVQLCLAGLPTPVLQHEVRQEFGRLVARVDMAWLAQRLIVEVDGFAHHSDRIAYRRDREKMNELERLGWRVLRVTWEDVVLRLTGFVELVAQCLGLPVLAA